MELLSLRGIRKFFPSTGTCALSGADFDLEKGEVHALVGENGAGKSTLARIACGLVAPDGGSIELRGKPVRFRNHRDAERAGIGLVPQYSMLAPGLTVAQNLALGHEPLRFGLFYDRRKAEYDASLLAERYGFSVPPDARVADLGPSLRREAEILRALARGADLLILDEPTSILSDEEARALFDLIRRLSDAGTGIIYISHRAREILDLARRITVLREGRTLATVDSHGLDECELSELIVSTGTCSPGGDAQGSPGGRVLELRGVSLGQGETLDLVVREWEAVAVVALAGNALDELEDIAVGLRRLPPGQVLLLGKALASYPAAELYGSVLGYLPTDREARALSLRSSALDNCIAKRVPGYSARQFAFRAAPKRDAQALMTGYGIRGTLCGPAESLSGGNRQRLVVARELSSVPKLVVAANPCQGLDPAGRARVLGRLAELRDAGAAVLLLTQDPEDASQLGDRVFALYRGRLTPLSGDEVKAGKLSSVLTGVLA